MLSHSLSVATVLVVLFATGVTFRRASISTALATTLPRETISSLVEAHRLFKVDSRRFMRPLLINTRTVEVQFIESLDSGYTVIIGMATLKYRSRRWMIDDIKLKSIAHL